MNLPTNNIGKLSNKNLSNLGIAYHKLDGGIWLGGSFRLEASQ